MLKKYSSILLINYFLKKSLISAIVIIFNKNDNIKNKLPPIVDNKISLTIGIILRSINKVLNE